MASRSAQSATKSSLRPAITQKRIPSKTPSHRNCEARKLKIIGSTQLSATVCSNGKSFYLGMGELSPAIGSRSAQMHWRHASSWSFPRQNSAPVQNSQRDTARQEG